MRQRRFASLCFAASSSPSERASVRHSSAPLIRSDQCSAAHRAYAAIGASKRRSRRRSHTHPSRDCRLAAPFPQRLQLAAPRASLVCTHGCPPFVESARRVAINAQCHVRRRRSASARHSRSADERVHATPLCSPLRIGACSGGSAAIGDNVQRQWRSLASCDCTGCAAERRGAAVAA